MEEDREYIDFQNIKFFWHPYFKYYLASKCGKILSLKWNKKRILKLHRLRNGYLNFKLCENNARKDYSVHRFIYECFKGTIPVDKQVDHIDNNKENNLISNLQLLTPSENIRKSHFKKKVISLNIETKEKKIFDSLKQTAEYHQISGRAVGYSCQKINKIIKSKKDGMKYQFFYL